MALVLNIKQGESFYIEDTQYVMEKVISNNKFTLRENGFITRKFEVDDSATTDLGKSITVQAAPSWRENIGRVAISAPKDMKILRETLYENQGD